MCSALWQRGQAAAPVSLWRCRKVDWLSVLAWTDTACSSSLVATHAAQERMVWAGGSAAVGGVNAILTPDSSSMFAAAHMLAADGRRAVACRI